MNKPSKQETYLVLIPTLTVIILFGIFCVGVWMVFNEVAQELTR